MKNAKAKQAREAENLRRMATVVRDSNDAITIQDFEGRITAWNRGAELMYGHSEAEALLMNIERLTTPGKVAEQKEFIRRLVAGEAITSFETQRVTKDGRVLDVWMTVTKLMDDAGNPIGLASTERDITARKREEENLRRMATVVRDSNDAITIQDFEGRITAWNRGAELMYGHSEAEALLMNIELLTTPGKVAEQKEFIRRLVAGEAITSFETQRVTKDGRVLDVWMTVTKLMDDAGNPIGLASTERDITARKREKENLRRMATVVRDSNDAITIQDFEGRITAWNRGAELMYGHSEAEALLMNIELLTTPGKVAEQKEFIRRLVAGEAITSFETQRVTKDGRVLDVWMTVTKLMDDAGNPIGLASTERDITARKREKENLRRMATVVLDSNDAITIQDFEGRIAAWNRGAELMYGHSEAEALLMNIELLTTPGKVAEQREFVRRLVAGEAITSFETQRVTKDGRVLDVWMTVTKLMDDAGNPIGLASTERDITARKREAEQMARLKWHYELILCSTAEGILGLDLQGNHTFGNPAAHRMLGYEAEELLDGPSHSVWHHTKPDGSPYPSEECQINAAFQDGAVHQSSVEFFWRKDGASFPVEYTSTPIWEQGRLAGAVATFVDITDRLRSAEEKARLEDQLRQAQKMEAIGRLAGGVAHDFNNMTAIVLGYAEMLLGRLGPEDPARKWAEQIVAAGQRSAALTHQLLAFSRRQILLPVVLDLNVLLGNLEKMLSRLIGEDIELAFRLAADLGRVTADPGQIEQVVTNLVINARDAMPRGGRLTVETADVELDENYALNNASVIPGRYVLLTLTDTGCGMDRATMARLFEPFFTTKEKGKGTGLGLATAFGIVKQSGGYIWAYSEPGKGTSFKIYLPRTDAEPKANEVDAGGAIQRGRGELILLVEDEASLLVLCEATLSRLGYRVSAAGSGPEALLLVEEQRLKPDLIITDVVMPGMSGAELTEQLRRDRPDLKVLYMSGYPDDAIVRHGVLDLGTPFIQKPFTERSLAVKVREALGGKAAAARPGMSVLMIDDDEQYRELVRHFCTKRGHVFAGVDSAAAALAALAAQPCDVLLVDLNIPGTSGEHVLRKIRAAGHAAPAIVLTGDVASADLDVLRPLGVVRALEKSCNAEPMLRAIEETAILHDSRCGGGAAQSPAALLDP